jgi:hypothetical protein
MPVDLNKIIDNYYLVSKIVFHFLNRILDNHKP